MKVALTYVHTERYHSQTIFEYLGANKPQSVNASLNSQPFIQAGTDLDASSQPKAILFEQTKCPDCDLFHRCVLSLDSVRDRFKPFHTVQLDMWSKAPVITQSGDIKTSNDFARDLKITYAPSLVLFDTEGHEIIRVESQLRKLPHRSCP